MLPKVILSLLFWVCVHPQIQLSAQSLKIRFEKLSKKKEDFDLRSVIFSHGCFPPDCKIPAVKPHAYARLKGILKSFAESRLPHAAQVFLTSQNATQACLTPRQTKAKLRLRNQLLRLTKKMEQTSSELRVLMVLPGGGGDPDGSDSDAAAEVQDAAVLDNLEQQLAEIDEELQDASEDEGAEEESDDPGSAEAPEVADVSGDFSGIRKDMLEGEAAVALVAASEALQVVLPCAKLISQNLLSIAISVTSNPTP